MGDMTFNQAQLILNTYYTLEMSPFSHTAKPQLPLESELREQMRWRIRRAKAELVPERVSVPRETFRKVADEVVPFILSIPEAEDVLVALKAVLAEARLDPLNIEPLLSAKTGAVEKLIEHVERLVTNKRQHACN